MAGARSMAVGGAIDCSLPSVVGFRTSVVLARKPELCNSFLQHDSSRRLRASSDPRRKRSSGRTFIVDELGGHYEEGFEDVHRQIINYFTYKASRTVLHQLYEMNPPKYTWFYNFVATNNPTDGERFLRDLGKEKQDLAERVMITRLHLYGKWIKAKIGSCKDVPEDF
ncbi:chaperonin-like RbcX protein 2, chloroplastic [Iris pallida]|uniref:Chaperonin-like RbcX protein 2, chloroplastic n=1 Tax=Iris pallida TaxID=29817 RepID=A0AAX6DIC0_IRIPA|nr:chaperonin-like RbcX protein 2, chloroplastic [Iris pallida]